MTFGLGASNFMSVSALHYLGHTNISSWGKKKEKNKAHYHQHGRLEGSREICINLSAAYRGQFLGTKH